MLRRVKNCLGIIIIIIIIIIIMYLYCTLSEIQQDIGRKLPLLA